MTRVLILGGGHAGMLAAAVFDAFAEVVVVEADALPAVPEPRRGVPQSPHNHMLMGGGADAVDQLLPGTTARLFEAGAHRLPMAERILTLSSEGWFGRPPQASPGEPYVIGCSRDLIDHVVRSRLRELHPGVTVLESTRVIGLEGDAKRVCGVWLGQGEERRLERADLVVDATGSRSQLRAWLAEIGGPQVPESFVDPKLAYAGRIYAAPPGVGPLPGVLIQPEPATGLPGRGAAFMPQEDGRWIVSLMGTRGANPGTGEDEFLAFARGLRHPLVADLIESATPISKIRGSHGLANRRRDFHKVAMPSGLLAIGDSVMALSPNYATGLSLSARQLLWLRGRLAAKGLAGERVNTWQRGIARLNRASWDTSTSTDILFPGAESSLVVKNADKKHAMTTKFTRVAAENPVVLRAIYRLATVSGSQQDLMRPRILAAVLRGPRRPPLTGEQAIGQFPDLAKVLGSRPILQDD